MSLYKETVDPFCLSIAEDLVANRLPAIMQAHPDLNDAGYGRPHEHFEFCAEEEHQLLLKYVGNIAFALCWLAEEGRVVQHDWTPNNTYGLKNWMADQTGKYVSNGEMCAAFLILDLPILLDDFSPSVLVIR